MNKYWENAIKFQEKILEVIKSISQEYQNELQIKIEDVNLPGDKDSVIGSSTAIGFCLEEFFSVKLKQLSEKFSIEFKRNSIEDQSNKVTNSSYDFYYYFNDEKFLINFKVDKGNNNAISAINKIYEDYVLNNDENIDYHYLILKAKYKINDRSKIEIIGFDSFYLEEINFDLGHHQDSRNWSSEFNKNSGRMIISNNHRETQKMPIEKISYNNTKDQITKIYNKNLQKEVDSQFDQIIHKK
ncbi:UpaP162 family type II restriction enzyme [Mycoplasmopsis gallinacea]|uniref:Restriction endonuclease n=1 Tax=Mycoplasmopsis gallinacea TaxID=29556 RepID=A0A6H0V2Q9_9BACT|nr:hypothetical protein [Mycoplasmopsis gallinacea]QIW62482.1 hypothetical protein GOQ20_03625 [Mycoplasmopsis gallinacea]